MSEPVATLRGLPEFKRALAQISERVATRVLRATAAAGARLVRKAVRGQAPVGPYASKKRGGVLTPAGVLKQGAIIKFAPERSGTTQAAYLVLFRRKRGKSARAGVPYYAPWVEAGHRIVPRRGSRGATVGTQRARRAAARGRVPPHPFFRPAVDASAGAALQAMQTRMAQELVKVLR